MQAFGCSSFSSRATQSVTCFGLEMFLPITRAQSRAPPSSSARHATAAHTSSSSTRLMLGSAAFTLAMSARATSSSAGVGRMALIVAGTPRLSEATNSWRNSACGLYTFT